MLLAAEEPPDVGVVSNEYQRRRRTDPDERPLAMTEDGHRRRDPEGENDGGHRGTLGEGDGRTPADHDDEPEPRFEPQGGTDRGGDSFAASEAMPHREAVSDDGSETGREARSLPHHEVTDHGGHEALGDVADDDERRHLPAHRAQDVGRPGVAAPHRVDVGTGQAGNDDAEIDAAEDVGRDEDDGGGGLHRAIVGATSLAARRRLDTLHGPMSIDPRTEVRRVPDRADYDRATIDAILDEALICHVGFVDEGQPIVIPTIHVRVGDTLVLHGSPASRMLRLLGTGAEVSIAVTLLDGLVLARSVFHHSMNYRSVVLFGTPERIDDPDRKLEAMRTFTEKVLPGRWGDARVPNDKEFRGTLMVGVAIDAASAKVRKGGPVDDEEDYAMDVWAGVVPMHLAAEPPVADERLRKGVAYPSYLEERFGPVSEEAR